MSKFIHKDFLDQELNIGDRVICIARPRGSSGTQPREYRFAKVDRMTECFVFITEEKENVTFKQGADQLIKVNNE